MFRGDECVYIVGISIDCDMWLRCSVVKAYAVRLLAIMMYFLRKLVDKGSFWPDCLGPCKLGSYLTYMPLRVSW